MLGGAGLTEERGRVAMNSTVDTVGVLLADQPLGADACVRTNKFNSQGQRPAVL